VAQKQNLNPFGHIVDNFGYYGAPIVYRLLTFILYFSAKSTLIFYYFYTVNIQEHHFWLHALFYKNARLSFFSKFKNKLRTLPDSAKKQSLKFSIKVVNKTATRAAQLVKRILLYTFSRTTAAPSNESTIKNFMQLI